MNRDLCLRSFTKRIGNNIRQRRFPCPGRRQIISRFADSTKTPTQKAIEEKIIAALRTIYDPEIPVNIYDLGLIYTIDIDPTIPLRSSSPLAALVAADRGHRVFFSTVEGLVSQDTNGREDIYEWHGGILSIITRNPGFSDPRPQPKLFYWFITTSADGRRVYFTTPERLTAGAS